MEKYLLHLNAHQMILKWSWIALSTLQTVLKQLLINPIILARPESPFRFIFRFDILLLNYIGAILFYNLCLDSILPGFSAKNFPIWSFISIKFPKNRNELSGRPNNTIFPLINIEITLNNH